MCYHSAVPFVAPKLICFYIVTCKCANILYILSVNGNYAEVPACDFFILYIMMNPESC